MPRRAVLSLLFRVVRAAPLVATSIALIWALSMHPFAMPFVERQAADLARTLEARVARRATTDWIDTSLRDAVAAQDGERAAMLLELAEDLDRPVDRAAAEALIDRQASGLAGAAACGRCMLDIRMCRSVNQIAACALPFEMSPLGDLNALRRAGQAWAGETPVDTLDASLALIGLGATGAVLVSGGSSATVKAGTGLLRMARRMGSLTPSMARLLRLPVRPAALPAYLAGRAPLDTVTDTARLARLGGVARDMGRVRAATSTPEALRLMRLVDTPEDAARLARVAEAAGPRTSRTAAVLGKSRLFRATVRLSSLAASTLILLWVTVLQVCVGVASWLGGRLLRAFLPR
ncbi:hypothetical protein [Jannaschia sp. 2305UL9-9]|uniref:hypothetical protein n=1 Tax=Jannaschia sp. 2305UL9-9 TaxID=3121638 RepID=UPI0035278ADD